MFCKIIMETQLEPTWKFLFRWIASIISWPINLIISFKDPEHRKKLLDPIKIPIAFFFEAKITASLIIINIIIYFTVNILLSLGIISQQSLSSLILNSNDFRNPSFFIIIKILFSMFMHANLIHLFSNMFFLDIFGRVIENRYTEIKTLFIYFLAGIISSLASGYFFLFFYHQNVYMLGASGSIMGLVGVAMLINPFKISFSVGLPLPIAFLGWLQIISDLLGITSMGDVNHIAHITGMLSMVILVYIFSSDRAEMSKGLAVNIISIIIIVFFREIFLHPFDINSIRTLISGVIPK